MKKTYNLKLNSIEMELSEEEVQNLLNQLAFGKPTHKRKYFVPKVGEMYYAIDEESFSCDTVTVSGYLNKNCIHDKNKISIGNCFATEQDAQDELNRRQALVRIWNNYDDKYSWDIDWEDRTVKHTIHYDYMRKTISGKSWGFEQHNTELPYFKSTEDRNQFVSENELDILTVYNIKK